MKFCSECGSYMKKTKQGFLCPKCGHLVSADAGMQPKILEKTSYSGLVFVGDNPPDDYIKVPKVCPKCGNNEAFRWFSRISGEHAGIRRERTIEYFKCTKCSHTWAESS